MQGVISSQPEVNLLKNCPWVARFVMQNVRLVQAPTSSTDVCASWSTGALVLHVFLTLHCIMIWLQSSNGCNFVDWYYLKAPCTMSAHARPIIYGHKLVTYEDQPNHLITMKAQRCKCKTLIKRSDIYLLNSMIFHFEYLKHINHWNMWCLQKEHGLNVMCRNKLQGKESTYFYGAKYRQTQPYKWRSLGRKMENHLAKGARMETVSFR